MRLLRQRSRKQRLLLSWFAAQQQATGLSRIDRGIVRLDLVMSLVLAGVSPEYPLQMSAAKDRSRQCRGDNECSCFFHHGWNLLLFINT